MQDDLFGDTLPKPPPAEAAALAPASRIVPGTCAPTRRTRSGTVAPIAPDDALTALAAALQLLGADGQTLATIENKPGQTGSLVVYAALAALYGGQITPAAASLGLEWYAEHVADARAFPGKHPNIDRLLAWAQGSESFAVRTVAA